MENEKRLDLISREALIADLRTAKGLGLIIAETIVRFLKKQPTVDAVEVVRCKDCKWYNRNEDIMPQSGSCEFHEMVKMDWDFCSRAKMDGERKDNEERNEERNAVD